MIEMEGGGAIEVTWARWIGSLIYGYAERIAVRVEAEQVDVQDVKIDLKVKDNISIKILTIQTRSEA